MVKGSVKIELKDENSGEVQTYTHDNLITNAVQDIINVGMKIFDTSTINDYTTSQTPSYNGKKIFPVYKWVLGGILLFKENLVEDANNMSLPIDTYDFDLSDMDIENTNELIGYASNEYYYDASDIRNGQLNQIESKELTDENGNVTGYQFVWDFTTSEANGEINSVSLTSPVCGAKPFITSTTTSSITNTISASVVVNDNKFRYAVDYDPETSILTCVYPEATVEGETIADVIKRRKYFIPINKFSFNNQFLQPELVSEETIKIPTYTEYLEDETETAGTKSKARAIEIMPANELVVKINTSERFSVCCDEDNYYVVYPYRWGAVREPGDVFGAVVIKKNDFTKISYWFNNSYEEYEVDQYGNTTNAIESSSRFMNYISWYSGYCICYNKRLYFYTTNTKFYEVQIPNSNTSQAGGVFHKSRNPGTDSEINFGASMPRSAIYNNVIYNPRYMQAYKKFKSISSIAMGFLYNNEQYCYISDSGKCLTVSYAGVTTRLNFGHIRQYLGTINNLEETVHKTSAQSMKITYTLLHTAEKDT